MWEGGGGGGGQVICFLNHFANLNHPENKNVITIITHTATEKEGMPACAVSKMVSKLSITSNLLCVLLVDLGMFFLFLNNGCPISCTILLGPPTLAGCMGHSHWQAVWDRLTLAGCMGQTHTGRLYGTDSNRQDLTDRI